MYRAGDDPRDRFHGTYPGSHRKRQSGGIVVKWFFVRNWSTGSAPMSPSRTYSYRMVQCFGLPGPDPVTDG